MRADEVQTRELLRAHDDPARFEFPAGHDYERAAARFDQLGTQLRAAFGIAGSYAGQDSSLHGAIEIPAASTAGGLRLLVRVSNFGDLTAVSSEESLYCDDAELAEIMHPADATRVYGTLEGLGYIVLRLDPLEEMYNGVAAHLRRKGATWRHRYFDYL
jgi:hypothetical protein